MKLNLWLAIFTSIVVLDFGLHAGIHDLQDKRQEVAKQISIEEAERQQLEQDLTILTKRLAQVDASLQRKVRITLSVTTHAIPLKEVLLNLLIWLILVQTSLLP